MSEPRLTVGSVVAGYVLVWVRGDEKVWAPLWAFRRATQKR